LKREGFASVFSKRINELRDYQNSAYAKEYEEFVKLVRERTSEKLALAVAKNLYKLMAYKDEYEVARLHADAEFNDRIKNMFEGDYKIYYHLAPPIFAKTNEKGELIKQKMGPWTLLAFKVLKRLKFLRGSFLDIFGNTAERKSERKLIAEYKSYIDEVIKDWSPLKEGLAIQIANVPESIKGYGHVKEGKMMEARKDWLRLIARWKIVESE